MIYNNLEFHNVAEVETMPGFPGVRLQRFPEEIRMRFGAKDNERGRFFSQKAVGCEIRFVTEAGFFRISLMAAEQDGEVLIYRGDFFHSTYQLKAGMITTLHIEAPVQFANVQQTALQCGAFSSKVWRLMFGKNCNIHFVYLDTFGHSTRPPNSDEQPSLKWLAYGSSITFGGDTTVFSNSYVHQAARRLGVDVINKGMAGSCFCEDFIADYLAGNEKWDFITLELGVNMRGNFEPGEYKERVSCLLEKLIKKRPENPIIVTGIYPNGADFDLDPVNMITRNSAEFNTITEALVNEMKHPHIYYIQPKSILSDFSGLSVDLLHPSNDGHILMGENLGRYLKPILSKYFKL